MLSVSDIVKLLDQVPVWRTIKALPARFEALERRVAELEAAAATPARIPGQPCPACGAHALRRTASIPSTTPFGDLGARDEVWTCGTCGTEDHRSAVMKR